MGRGRMDERDERPFGARPRFAVDQTNAARAEMRQRRADVVDAQRDVVKSRTALADVGRNRRVRSSCLEQLQRRAAHRDARALTRSVATSSGASTSSPRASAVEGQRLVDVLNSDADVVEDGFHRVTTPTR